MRDNTFGNTTNYKEMPTPILDKYATLYPNDNLGDIANRCLNAISALRHLQKLNKDINVDTVDLKKAIVDTEEVMK